MHKQRSLFVAIAIVLIVSIALADLPECTRILSEPVKAAFQNKFPLAMVTKCDTKTDQNSTTYTISFTQDTTKYEATYDAGGKGIKLIKEIRNSKELAAKAPLLLLFEVVANLYNDFPDIYLHQSENLSKLNTSEMTIKIPENNIDAVVNFDSTTGITHIHMK